MEKEDGKEQEEAMLFKLSQHGGWTCGRQAGTQQGEGLERKREKAQSFKWPLRLGPASGRKRPKTRKRRSYIFLSQSSERQADSTEPHVVTVPGAGPGGGKSGKGKYTISLKG